MLGRVRYFKLCRTLGDENNNNSNINRSSRLKKRHDEILPSFGVVWESTR